MRTTFTHRVGPAAITLSAWFAAAVLVAAWAQNAAAQTPLSSGVCVGQIGVPSHYSFTKSSIPYWAVVGVAPDPADDKDIYLYSGPSMTGSLLASSNGVSGSDFIVADFNHTSYGTYYPSVTYGSTTALYVVEWSQGGNILPLNQTVGVPVYAAGSGSCYAFQVWDVYLEAGATYRILSYFASIPIAIALFRNPGTGNYFAGRSQAVVDLVGDDVYADYTAPTTDWYGLVVMANARVSNSGWADFEVRKLGTCEPLAAGNCVSAIPYNLGGTPADSYSFEQGHQFWAAIAAAPSSGDDKNLRIRSACDYTVTDTPLAKSAPGTSETALIVADFNHGTPLPTSRFVDVDSGSTLSPYTIEFEGGADFFAMNSQISGSVGGTEGPCNLVEVWDIFMESPRVYRISFSRTGTADIVFAGFRNPGTGPYYADRSQADYMISGAGGSIQTPWPWTDWYGFTVFADKRGESGTYTLAVEEVNDCDAIPSGTCVSSQGNAKDFHIGATENNYWFAVGVLPSDGDDKDISVYSLCDGEGSLFGFSNGTQGADFVVADCNHPPSTALSDAPELLANNWYPRVIYGSTTAPYTVSSDLGNDISQDLFPHDVVVEGGVAGTSGDCGMIKIWDIYLQQGVQYRIGFTRSGDADVRLALFRNPTNYRLWTGRAGREWELPESQNFLYTAPATDYYGIVVFANRRGKLGTYAIRFSSGVTGIDTEPPMPDQYALYQSTPNPFNPTTAIQYNVPSGGGRVSLRVYDVNGRLVRTLVDEDQPGGRKTVTWDAKDDRGKAVATGVYFYRLEAPGFGETRKTVLMK